MLSFEMDDDGLQKAIRIPIQGLADARAPLREFQTYMGNVTIEHFQALRLGGAHRGVTWPYFSPQYTRKTDGVTVPAWGGVPTIGRNSWINQRAREKRGEKVKVREGRVKGRKRPSGKRIKQGDSVLQDTRRLLRSVSTAPDYQLATTTSLTWGTRLHYAEKQHKRRPFLFFTEADVTKLESLIAKYILRGNDGSTG